jgi:hypothetical protein
MQKKTINKLVVINHKIRKLLKKRKKVEQGRNEGYVSALIQYMQRNFTSTIHTINANFLSRS